MTNGYISIKIVSFQEKIEGIIPIWKGMFTIMRYLDRILMAFGFTLLLTCSASAYLDPSVMTYTIQVVAGVVVAVGAVVGIYWRKTKKKLKDKMGIDEDSKKEVEADVVEFKDDAEEK